MVFIFFPLIWNLSSLHLSVPCYIHTLQTRALQEIIEMSVADHTEYVRINFVILFIVGQTSRD